MKRNRLFILGIVTVLVALLSLTLVSGTFAKYTSSATVQDTAKVAKWQVKAGQLPSELTDISAASVTSFTATLFQNAVYELDANTVTTTADTEVAQGSKIIAPGSGSKFVVDLENDSEVTADAVVTLKKSGSTIPTGMKLMFSFTNNGTDWAELTADLVAPTVNLPHTTGNTGSVTVYYMWAFNNGDDATDTSLGIAKSDITLNVEVTFTQVD